MSGQANEHGPDEPGAVLSVGQCGFDNSQIRELIRSVDPELQVLFADDLAETLQILDGQKRPVRLVLVNRILDADHSSGIELIRSLKKNHASAENIPMMLVSDLAAAQTSAVEAGARPGFGKSSIRSSATRDIIRGILESGG